MVTNHLQVMGWSSKYPYRVLKGGVSKGRVFLNNPEDSVWEDWGTLGKIRGITTISLRILLYPGNSRPYWRIIFRNDGEIHPAQRRPYVFPGGVALGRGVPLDSHEMLQTKRRWIFWSIHFFSTKEKTRNCQTKFGGGVLGFFRG